MKAIFILFFMNIALCSYAYPCTENESNCNSETIEVSVAVIESVSFNSIQGLDLGNITRGEFVSVSAVDSTQNRNKNMGILSITSDYNSAGVQVTCISSLSYISLNTGDVVFDNCEIVEQGSSSTPSSSILLNQTTGTSQTHNINIGGSIQIPNNPSIDSNSHSGVIRIEVQLL